MASGPTAFTTSGLPKSMRVDLKLVPKHPKPVVCLVLCQPTAPRWLSLGFHIDVPTLHFSADCRATPSPEFYLNPFFDRGRVGHTTKLPPSLRSRMCRKFGSVWKVSRETAKRNWVQKGQADSVMTWMESEIFFEKGAQKRRQRKWVVLSRTRACLIVLCGENTTNTVTRPDNNKTLRKLCARQVVLSSHPVACTTFAKVCTRNQR